MVMADLQLLYQALCTESRAELQECLLSRLSNTNVRSPIGHGIPCQHQRLDLTGESLTTNSCTVLGKLLARDDTYKELVLANCMLGEEGAKNLLSALCSSTSFMLLDLKGNSLRSGAAAAIGKFLRHSTSVKCVLLEWNALGVSLDGFSLLAEGIGSTSSLVRLDLSNNQIGPQGGINLGEALSHSSCLCELDLRWNNLGMLGGRAVLEGVAKCRTLCSLKVSGNDIPGDILRAIEQAVRYNTGRGDVERDSQLQSRVLMTEMEFLKGEKQNQFLDLMRTIESQREEMAKSSRVASSQLSQLQEKLAEQTSTINNLTVRLRLAESGMSLAEQERQNLAERLQLAEIGRLELRSVLQGQLDAEREESKQHEASLHEDLEEERGTNAQLRQQLTDLAKQLKAEQEQLLGHREEQIRAMAGLNLQLEQAERKLEEERRRMRKVQAEADLFRQKELQAAMQAHSEVEKALTDKNQQIQLAKLELQEELGKAKSAAIASRAEAEQELQRIRSEEKREEHGVVMRLEERLRTLTDARDTLQVQLSRQEQVTGEVQSHTACLAADNAALGIKLANVNKELMGKQEQAMLEVTKVRLELQQRIGHLEAELTKQEGLEEKVAVLERQLKTQARNHRDLLLESETQIEQLNVKLHEREVEACRARDDEARRARALQSAMASFLRSIPTASQDGT
uniref:leucine-rich repeat-containing protein 45 isoform X2 n=1 Tax=Myxine glutinosa TaxID=7769 RepID=UPI00358F2858